MWTSPLASTMHSGPESAFFASDSGSRPASFAGGGPERAVRPRLPKAVELAHRLVGERLRPGDAAVDATAGNGHDTLFLARAVGPGGRVLAFDVQPEAIAAATARIDQARRAGEMLGEVALVETGHENLATACREAGLAGVAAVMFNLGYLPGGDKGRITTPSTTMPALDASASLLAPGGILAVVIYSGHAGGEAERDAVLRWAARLDQRAFQAVRYGFLNQVNAPPELLAVQRHPRS